MKVKLRDIIQLNPKERIPKGKIAKKIAMDNLEPYCREIAGYEIAAYKGGTKFRNGDTLLARITPCLENGKTAYVNILEDGEVAFGSTEYFVFRAKEKVIDPLYLYYLSVSNNFRDVAIKSMTGTSGRQRVQKEAVLDYEFDLPNMEEQKKVASIIGSLDDKKLLNEKINDNLGKLIDLDFNKTLGNNSLESVTINNLGSIIGGGTPSKKIAEYWNGDIPWITPKDLSKSKRLFTSSGNLWITNEGLEKSSAKILPIGTVLYSSRAPIGYISIADNPITTNQGFKSIVPNKDYSTEFIFELLKKETDNLINSANGSTFKEISGTQLKNHIVKIPTKLVCQQFSERVQPMFRIIRKLEQENFILLQIKELLLNKFF